MVLGWDGGCVIVLSALDSGKCNSERQAHCSFPSMWSIIDIHFCFIVSIDKHEFIFFVIGTCVPGNDLKHIPNGIIFN